MRIPALEWQAVLNDERTEAMTETQTEVTPELRLKRLNMLLDVNEKCDPKTFSMAVFEEEATCGTLHCLFGNYAVAFNVAAGHQVYDLKDGGVRNAGGRDIAWPEDFGEHFGIEGQEALELFFEASRDYADSLQAVRDLIQKYATEGSAS